MKEHGDLPLGINTKANPFSLSTSVEGRTTQGRQTCARYSSVEGRTTLGSSAARPGTGVGTGTNLRYHDERCRAEEQTREERRAETQEKHGWKTPQYSLLRFFCNYLRFLSFIHLQTNSLQYC
jgi:hypothetical protein